MKKNIISMHSTIAGSANLATMAEAARRAGYDAIEPVYPAVYSMLDAGYSVEEIREVLAGLELPGIGWIEDLERQGEVFSPYLAECTKLFELCGQIGFKGVQILTGPIDMAAIRAYRDGSNFQGYMGLQDKDVSEQIRLTARNAAVLADAAAQFGVTLYLEPLCWTPMGKLPYALAILEETARDNFKMVVDFWQLFTAGATPDEIAKIPKEYIYGVHICDSAKPEAGVPDQTEAELRNVPFGKGIIPVKEYVDAVKATGFTGWWGCESFDVRQKQMALDVSASKNYRELAALVNG